MISRTRLVLFFVLVLAACGSDPLPPAPSGGGDGDGGGGSGGDGGGGTGGEGGTGGAGGTGGQGGTGGSGGTPLTPFEACSLVDDGCNGGTCVFETVDCADAVDGWLAQCASGACGMRDRDGNCPPRDTILTLCEAEKFDGASANTLWHCFTAHDACDDAFRLCQSDVCEEGPPP